MLFLFCAFPISSPKLDPALSCLCTSSFGSHSCPLSTYSTLQFLCRHAFLGFCLLACFVVALLQARNELPLYIFFLLTLVTILHVHDASVFVAGMLSLASAFSHVSSGLSCIANHAVSRFDSRQLLVVDLCRDVKSRQPASPRRFFGMEARFFSAQLEVKFCFLTSATALCRQLVIPLRVCAS